jgi:hypothetical protein
VQYVAKGHIRTFGVPRIAALRYALAEKLETIMSSYAGMYIGSTPQHYDELLGPLIFVDYAADIAQRVAAGNPARVLETAAGTGIVTRKLRDALPLPRS